MSSTITDSPILYTPNPAAIGPKPDEINIRVVKVGGALELAPTATFNGVVLTGNVVSESTAATFQNKFLVDTNNYFINATDSTKRLRFDVNSSTSTTSVVQINATASRTYAIPDSGANCNFVMSEGSQTINGAKTFTNFNIGTNMQCIPILVTTTNDTPTIAASISTSSGVAYCIIVELVAGSGSSMAAYKTSVRAKNIGGTITIGSKFDDWVSADIALSSAGGITFSNTGTTININVTGIAATNIVWSGASRILYGAT